MKQQIIDTKGWDSEELKAWYKEEEETFQYPISAGACKAYFRVHCDLNCNVV